MKNNSKFRLTNKITFVLGGVGLIGTSISKFFLENGSIVIILDINKANYKKFILNNKITSNKIFFEKFDCTKLNVAEILFQK